MSCRDKESACVEMNTISNQRLKICKPGNTWGPVVARAFLIEYWQEKQLNNASTVSIFFS